MVDGTRRSFVGGALALSTATLACSAPSSMATGDRRKAAPGVLQPGPGWTGVAGSGGRPPAESDRPFGTLVPDERFTGGFSAVPGQWIHGEGIRITALGLPPQPVGAAAINYFKEAVFYLEGNSITVTEWSVNTTPVRSHDGTMIPQGSIGFSVEIGAGEGDVTAGDAILYCFLRGEHGLERRIEIPLVINVDRKLDAKRRVCFVDPQRGSDEGDGSRSAPWRTLYHALGSKGVGDGGKLILQKPGRYVEDVNISRLPPLNNRRAIEVFAAEGLRADQVIITRTARRLPEPRWVIQARAVHFHGLTVDLGKIMLLWGPADRAIAFLGCRLVDPRGPEGDRDENGLALGFNLSKGTPAQRDTLAAGLPYSFGGFYLAECLFVNFTTQGARLYRNVTAYQTTDSFAGGPGYDNVVVDGYDVIMPAEGITRLHLNSHLEVASVQSGPQATTILTLVDPQDLPRQEKAPDLRLRFLSGVLAGQEEQILSINPGERRIVIRGDSASRVAAGDRIRCYAIWHADFCQQQGVQRPDQRGLRNITIFRYRASSPTSQLFLTQAPVRVEPKTRISTSGAQFQIISGTGKPNLVLDDDVLRLQEGPQAGEYRIVAAFDGATGTGTLLEPFSADQRDTLVERSKSINGFVMALSVLRKTGKGWEMGQFQDGHRNFLLTQNTFIGQPNCLSFRSKFPGHGHRNHVQLFNLISKMDADTPEFPSWGLRIERNHFLRGVSRGREGRVLDGRPVFDANNRYRPFRGQLSIGRKPLIPFDSFGNPVDENSPVGAVSV